MLLKQLGQNWRFLSTANQQHRDVSNIPSCRCRHQNKSWLTSELRKLDCQFHNQGNCPAHPRVENLANMTLIFLPPMDQGIKDQRVIKSSKAHIVEKLCGYVSKHLTKICHCLKLQL